MTVRANWRITFRCEESRGRDLLERWIPIIELEHEQAQRRTDARIFVEITTRGARFA